MKAFISGGSKVIYTKIYNFKVQMQSVIDRFWRKMDFILNRTYGGLLGEKLESEGHAPLIYVLVIVVLFFIIHGPTMGYRGVGALIVFFVSSAISILAVLIWNMRVRQKKISSNQMAFWFQLLLIVAVCGFVYTFAPETANESMNSLYHHQLIPLFLFLAVLPIIFSRLVITRLLFKDLRAKYGTLYKDRLKWVELFVAPPPYPTVTPGIALLSAINTLLRYPLYLLFVPAVAVLLAPYALREYIKIIALIFFLATWSFLSLASIVSELDSIIIQIRRFLFKGGQLIVSLVVIIFAAGRLFEFGYILTVVEGAKWTLGSYIITAYFCFWFYEYWMNRIVAEELIGFFRNADDPIGQARYPIDPGAVSSDVKAEKRVIQIHGFARLAVIGFKKGNKIVPENEVFQIYELIDFFRRLTEDVLPISRYRVKRLRRINSSVHSRIKSYFGILFLVGVFILGFGSWQLSKLNQVAGAKVVKQNHNENSDQSVSLRKQIFVSVPGKKKDKIILLAASGGGTRAALYTVSVLHGLSEIEMLGNLVLASGVSGGGASMAYFANHRDSLIKRKSEAHWYEFYETMSKPYIKEVLEGAAEIRVMGATRLGTLLDESFQRHFGQNTSLGNTDFEAEKMGLIFNTALAGHLHRDEGQYDESFEDWAEENRNLTKSNLAGSRLIFTNLKQIDAFPDEALEAYKLRYVVIDSNAVKLTTAAALHANFPPVFSNAAVDVLYEDSNRGDRYWVTDGGATDNRGIISLLFALKKSIQIQHIVGTPEIKPDIHIIVAEASAGSIDYHQDRGLGSKFGASQKFASQLMEELIHQVQELYQKIPGNNSKIEIHYLAMPSTLRFRGGLGTHWMMPELVRLVDTHENSPDLAENILLRKLDILNIIANLHLTKDKKDIFKEDGSLQWLPINWKRNKEKALSWIKQKDVHGQVWRNLVNALIDSEDPN